MGVLQARERPRAARFELTRNAVGHILPNVKVRELVGLLEQDGWYLTRTRGSHHQEEHPTKRALVMVPGNRNDELAPGTLNSILKQAGLRR